MKKFFKIVAVVLIVITLGVGVVFYLTSGMVDTATAFFEAAKRQDLATAHAHLSEKFREGTDENELKRFLSENGLLDFKEANWSSRSISGGRGQLAGEVKSASGGTLPVTLTFVEESGEWKIYSIEKSAAGLRVQPESPEIPSKAEQIVLVNRSMRDFEISVRNKSMEHFRETLSRTWQKEMTSEELNQAFGGAYDASWDLRTLETLEPVIEPVSELGSHDELILKGYFPTRPKQFHFEHTYIHEDTDWRLIGFSYEIK